MKTSVMAERNRKLVARYKGEDTPTVSTVAAEFGMSMQNARKILHEHGVLIEARGRGRRNPESIPELSDIHRAVGAEIGLQRVTEKLKRSDLANKLGIGTHQLMLIETGKAEITLSVLHRLQKQFPQVNWAKVAEME